ncbi:MAG: T9SS type A sorting domain-containing protein [Bacteroidota bacterium]
MKKTLYSRKINQFRNTARQINELIETNDWHSMSARPQRQLQWKLNNLFETVRNFLSIKEFKKILAAAAFLICIGTVNAQTFAPAVNNPYGLTNPGNYILPCFADMDNDGDLDIIAVSYISDILYYENTGTATSPLFAAPQTNPFGLDSIIYKPVTVDIDDDGDLDIFTCEYYGDLIYFENTGTSGTPLFSNPVINPFGINSATDIRFPSFADLDDDGDLDLLTTEYYGVFNYYENTGTPSNPSFTAPVSNPFGFSVGSTDQAFPDICDLDNDGDYDILTGSFDNIGNMYYYNNSGNLSTPDFSGTPLLNPFGLTATALLAIPTFGDLDNDGDFDLIVGDTTANFIYFENTTINSVNDLNNNSITFSVSPNPAIEYFTITTNKGENMFNLSIRDVTGKLIYENLTGEKQTIVNTSGFSKGVYIIELSDGNYISRKKLIIE